MKLILRLLAFALNLLPKTQWQPIPLCDVYGRYGLESPNLVGHNTAPTVTTDTTPTSITTSSAVFDTNSIDNTGGANATSRGICWVSGAGGTPTIANSRTTETGSFGTGNFSATATGLSAGTTYSVRAYATNSEGTGYGATVEVTTSSNSAPTIALNTADATDFGTDTTPTVEFTGSDTESDDLRYQVQIDTVDTFDTGNLLDNVSGTDIGFEYALEQIYGYTNTGTPNNVTGGSNNPTLIAVTLPNGDATKISAYVAKDASSSETLHAQGALYDDDKNLIATTNEVAISTTESLVDFPFSVPQSVSSGTYYIAIWSETGTNPGVDRISIYAPTGSEGDNEYSIDGASYNTWPDPVTFGTTSFLRNKQPSLNISVDASVSDLFIAGEKISFTVQAGDALSAGTYYWRARVIDPSGSNTYSSWATARSFTISSGGTATNDSRDAKVRGQNTANAERASKIKGQNTASDTRDVKITGVGSANDARDAKVTGTASANDSRDAKITGVQTANSSRDAKITGTASANDSRDAKVRGTADTTDERSAKVDGVAGANDSRDAKVRGTATDSDERDAKITGQNTDNDERASKIQGTTSDNDERDAKVRGQNTATAERSVKITGIPSSSERDARVRGQNTTNDSRDVKILGANGATSERSVKVRGSESATAERSSKIAGTSTDSDTRDVKVRGQDSASSERSVKVTGIASSDERDARIHGTATDSDTRDAKIRGQNTADSSRDAKIAGANTANDERSAAVVGQATDSDTRDAKVRGTADVTNERDAKVRGQNAADDSRDAKITGQNTASDERSVKITGIAASSERDARVAGTATASDDRSAAIEGTAIVSSERGAAITGIASTDERSAKVRGQDTANAERSAVVNGSVVIAGERDTRIRGQQTTDSERSAAIEGGSIGGIDTRDARIRGTDTASDSRNAKILGRRPFSALSDDFNDNSLDLGVWNASQAGGGSIENNGRLELDVNGDTLNSRELSTFERFNLTNSYLSMEVTVGANQSTYETEVGILNDTVGSTADRAYFHIKNGTLSAMKFPGGAVDSATYDATNHHFLRLREEDGTVYWEVSADGDTWSEFASSTGLNVSSARAVFFVTIDWEGEYRTTTIDNVNIFDSVSERQVKVRGTDNTSDERGAVIEGVFADEAERSAVIRGQLDSASERGAAIHGQFVIAGERESRIHGTADTSSERGAAIEGIVSSERGAVITGQEAVSFNTELVLVDGKPARRIVNNYYIRL